MESKPRKQAGQRKRYSDEFRAGAVRLILEQGKGIVETGRDLGVPQSVISRWVKQARIDAGKGAAGALTSAERAELSDLRKKVRVLEMERALLKKATAFFARENA